MADRIGFVGLGNMGAPMAANLVAAGWDVVGYDRDPAAGAAIDGLATARKPAAVAAPIVVLMLPNGAIVRDVLLGDAALAEALPPGAIVIDMSSVDPEVYGELGPELTRRGHALIDAPVSGNVTGARAGTLTIMAGGDAPAIARARPVLEALGGTVFETGALGTGQTTKALNNLLSAGGLIMAIEMLLVGKRAGLDPAQLTEILNVSTGRNNSTERKIAPFVLSGRYDSGFGLSLMAKDLRTAAAIAERAGVALPLAGHAVRIANLADEALGPGADHTAVAQWLEVETGVRLAA